MIEFLYMLWVLKVLRMWIVWHLLIEDGLVGWMGPEMILISHILHCD